MDVRRLGTSRRSVFAATAIVRPELVALAKLVKLVKLVELVGLVGLVELVELVEWSRSRIYASICWKHN